jgi:hypothetical protein
MSAFSPERVKARIAEILSARAPGEDVHVRLDNVPYGLWIWDEREGKHDHFSPAWMSRSLGVRRVTLPEVVLAWSDVG